MSAGENESDPIATSQSQTPATNIASDSSKNLVSNDESTKPLVIDSGTLLICITRFDV